MKTLKLSDAEYLMIKEAIDTYADIMNDTLFDSITAIELWPNKSITITPDQMEKFRDELSTGIDRVITLRTLVSKFNDEGVS